MKLIFNLLLLTNVIRDDSMFILYVNKTLYNADVPLQDRIFENRTLYNSNGVLLQGRTNG